MSRLSPRPLLFAGLLVIGHELAEALADEPIKEARLTPPPAEVQKLLQQLGNDRFLVRERASKQLIALGKPAVAALKEASSHRDAEIASRSQRILMEIQTSLPYLIDTLKEGEVEERKAAALALERLGEEAKEALPALVEALKDNEESVRDAAVSAVLSIDPFNEAVAEAVPAKAHVNGKYAKLLRRLKVAEDRQSYSEYRDYGYYQQCDWAGHFNIPAGYWVYVYPHWYIWRDQPNNAP
jgi:HEAT repeat protein